MASNCFRTQETGIFFHFHENDAKFFNSNHVTLNFHLFDLLIRLSARIFIQEMKNVTQNFDIRRKNAENFMVKCSKTSIIKKLTLNSSFCCPATSMKTKSCNPTAMMVAWFDSAPILHKSFKINSNVRCNYWIPQILNLCIQFFIFNRNSIWFSGCFLCSKLSSQITFDSPSRWRVLQWFTVKEKEKMD